MAIPVKQFLEEYRVIVEETAVEVFGSVEEFIKAYNAEVDAQPKRRYNTNINSKQGAKLESNLNHSTMPINDSLRDNSQ